MVRLLVLNCLLFASYMAGANTILVKNSAELSKATKIAKPGDIIILQNGEWKNVNIALDCNGNKEQPIIFKAQTSGKVLITGESKLSIGGNYIIVDGLYFTNGYAGRDAVIKFRIDKNKIANNCRVTNIVINDFNNPQRMNENNWVIFYGKKNQLDHCSFIDKKNMGVLLSVTLEDKRSQENFHSIDHNYFGFRKPLASNSGEIIRVGVSEQCEFNSNTQIVDNFFEHCDGETEIISIKSGQNVIRNNFFKECQGAVVLRHGDFNTVENNIFLGNNKEGTGGVRIINKGQWVVNNFFYQCRGVGFRSSLSVMNGVPNSPAFRYVPVTDAVIANNTFFDCGPISLCEGSDTERSVSPQKVQFLNNLFYNNTDSLIYQTHDDISGISFSGNLVNKRMSQNEMNGFLKTTLKTQKISNISMPYSGENLKNTIGDSLLLLSRSRLSSGLSNVAGFKDAKHFLLIETNANTQCGAKWFSQMKTVPTEKALKVDCKSSEEIMLQLAKKSNHQLIINLTGKEYHFNTPLDITTDVLITSSHNIPIKFSFPGSGSDYSILIAAGKQFLLKNINLDLSSANAKTFITTDTSGSSNHSNFSMNNCTINNFNGTFFSAAKSSISDSIIINQCTFKNSSGILFNFAEETDKKGYYNVEKLKITNNEITGYKGQVLAMLRGGNDESTLGPLLDFSNNKLNNCITNNDEALIHLYGTQRSFIEKNSFIKCNTNRDLILFEDAVRADHLFKNNIEKESGKIITNKFVRMN
jgi:poly(beta-D-mannuronate) lyase